MGQEAGNNKENGNIITVVETKKIEAEEGEECKRKRNQQTIPTIKISTTTSNNNNQINSKTSSRLTSCPSRVLPHEYKLPLSQIAIMCLHPTEISRTNSSFIASTSFGAQLAAKEDEEEEEEGDRGVDGGEQEAVG